MVPAASAKWSEFRYRRVLLPLGESLTLGNFLAVVVHVHYSESWGYLRDAIEGVRATGLPIDVVVTISTRDRALRARVGNDIPDARVVLVPNRGRDVLPFIKVAGVLAEHGYGAVIKIHSKQSVHFSSGRDWLLAMLHSLLPDEATVRNTIQRLSAPDTGVVGPLPAYCPLELYWEQNSSRVCDLIDGLVGFESSEQVRLAPANHGFFAGTMFWARLDAIQPLLQFRSREFEIESGQLDATFAHALERMFTLLPALTGRTNLTISDRGLSPCEGGPKVPEWFRDAQS